MNENSIVLCKAKAFGIRAVNLHKYLKSSKGEFVLTTQLLRSATSIGANITEALNGISRKDFLAKMYIAFKEASESQYWIEILYNTGYLTEQEYLSIHNDCSELCKMLNSITRTTRSS